MSNPGGAVEIHALKNLSAEDRKRILARGFVEAESVAETVREIIDNVRRRGDEALAEYARKLDKVDISPDKLRVTGQEIKAAYDLVDRKVVKAIETLSGNIRRFHQAQLPQRMWSMEISPGLIGGQIFIPLQKAGSYVPGGRGWFPSSVMMSVIPAKVAGVPEVVVCTPPMADGRINPGVLVACDITGADKVFRVSGAQSIAAMALGTRSVPKVDKVTGPGSKWVLAAFRLLQGEVAVGTQAGPGEGTDPRR